MSVPESQAAQADLTEVALPEPPPFTMLGNASGAACVDGVCAVPGPPEQESVQP